MSARNVCFTCNNYTDDFVQSLKEISKKYIVFGFEVGDMGTPHLQGYIEFASSKRWSTIHKLLPGCHTEARKGTAQEAADYCKKDGDYYEDGVISRQGARPDLDALKVDIMEHGKSVDDICVEHPMLFHQYGRTLSRLEDIALRKKFRTEMTQGIWYWGPTAVGKSHRAFKETTGTDFDPSTHYVWKNDHDWQCGYTGQETVIINDFRGEIKYNELLQLVDKWPYTLNRRGREPVPFLAKLVIITSSIPPDECYRRRAAEDSIEQLNRRFKVIEVTAAEVVRG